MIKKAETITEVSTKGVQEVKNSKDHTAKETNADKEDIVKGVTEKEDIIRETTSTMRVVRNATMNTIQIVHQDPTREAKEVDLEERKRIIEIHTTYERSTTHQKSIQIQTIGNTIAMTQTSF
jgi:hypothetical protein